MDAPIQRRVRGKKCSWKDCDKKHKAKGLCRLHYGRRKHGTPMDAPVQVHVKGGRKGNCSYPGCNRKYLAKDLCTAHYFRQRRGSLTDGPVVSKEPCPEETKNQREHNRWSQYRVTPSMWKDLVKMQRGTCRMCRERAPTEIDHYHAPGTDIKYPRDATLIRGAVCRRCNTVLGRYETDLPSPLKASRLIWLAENYLQKERPFAD